MVKELEPMQGPREAAYVPLLLAANVRVSGHKEGDRNEQIDCQWTPSSGRNFKTHYI